MTTATATHVTPRKATLLLALIGAGIVFLTLVGPSVHLRLGNAAFAPLIIVCSAGAAWALHLSLRADAGRALWIVLTVAAVMRLAMLSADNYLSSDIFRYIWDGRVQAAGINPYRYVPSAPELSFLRDTAIYPHINRPHHAVTIYPPAAQMMFLFLTRFGEKVVVMKVGLLVFDAITIAALIAILRLLGKTPASVVAYAWHPLPVWEIAGNGHVDAAMVALLVLALWAALQGQTLRAGVLATVGALVKPTALVALPVFWRPWDWRLPLAVGATVLLLYLPYLSVGWGVVGYLPSYVQEEGIATGAGFWLVKVVQRLTGPLTAVKWLYLAVAAVVLITLALRAGFRADRTPEATIRALAGLMLAFLFLLSPDYPWYFLALVPFLALTPRVAPWVVTTGALMLYKVSDSGMVYRSDVGEHLLYGATLIALAYDLWLGRPPRATLHPGGVRS